MFFKKPRNIKHSIKIKLPRHRQEIFIGRQVDDFVVEWVLSHHYSNTIILVDTNFLKINKRFIEFLSDKIKISKIIPAKPTEESKSFKFLNSTLEKCYASGLGRKSCIMAIGGGIVGDIAGFLASIYMRGIDFIFIPTTLMAQADTIINKVAISYKLLKNIVGSFYSPILTVCDVSFLDTLQKEEISLGLSEIIKHSLLDSDKHFNYIKEIIGEKMQNQKQYPWEDIIYRSLAVKKHLVEKDPFDDSGFHKGLSYGRCFRNEI